MLSCTVPVPSGVNAPSGIAEVFFCCPVLLSEPEKPKKETGSVGTILFILAALLAVGGIGYYVKIVRPKQLVEDDAEFEDDGYGEGFDPDEAYGEPEYLSEDDFDDKDSK